MFKCVTQKVHAHSHDERRRCVVTATSPTLRVVPTSIVPALSMRTRIVLFINLAFLFSAHTHSHGCSALCAFALDPLPRAVNFPAYARARDCVTHYARVHTYVCLYGCGPAHTLGDIFLAIGVVRVYAIFSWEKSGIEPVVRCVQCDSLLDGAGRPFGSGRGGGGRHSTTQLLSYSCDALRLRICVYNRRSNRSA